MNFPLGQLDTTLYFYCILHRMISVSCIFTVHENENIFIFYFSGILLLLSSFYGLISIASVIGNTLVIFVVATSKSMQVKFQFLYGQIQQFNNSKYKKVNRFNFSFYGHLHNSIIHFIPNIRLNLNSFVLHFIHSFCPKYKKV